MISIAQEYSDKEKGAPVTIKGNFNANMVLYNVDGISARRDPLYWMLSGNMVIGYKDLIVPLSATFSQQNKNFTQPYNQFGISPKYKSLTVHAGYRSMVF